MDETIATEMVAELTGWVEGRQTGHVNTRVFEAVRSVLKAQFRYAETAFGPDLEERETVADFLEAFAGQLGLNPRSLRDGPHPGRAA